MGNIAGDELLGGFGVGAEDAGDEADVDARLLDLLELAPLAHRLEGIGQTLGRRVVAVVVDPRQDDLGPRERRGRRLLLLGGDGVARSRHGHDGRDGEDKSAQELTHEMTHPHAHARILPGNCGLSRLTPSAGRAEKKTPYCQFDGSPPAGPDGP